MGILNATPDSFSDGGRHLEPWRAIDAGRQMLDDGALIVDVGGESTRPGAVPVSPEEEADRILPVIEGLAGMPVSVDTYRPEVARQALAAGAWLVNDIGGLRDPDMLAAVRDAGAGAVIMHMQGTPRTMQHMPQYGDVVAEVRDFLVDQASASGLDDVLIDPGIGFGKTLEHNLALLRNLDVLVGTGLPVLVGASRKGFIGSLARGTDAAGRDPGSIAVHLDAARRGAAMVRVHDVAAHVQALKVQEALL